MAWTAGVTKTTGDLITAAIWNSYLGASGSLDYLKATLESCTYSSPSRSIGTTYQNGSSIRMVLVSATMVDGDAIKGLIGTSSPASTEIIRFKLSDCPALYGVITFIVPPNYYYMVDDTGTPAISFWKEFDIH